MLDIRVELIEKEKLAYLRYILEGDNPQLAEERLYLLELLQGKKTVKDYIKEAQERNSTYYLLQSYRVFLYRHGRYNTPLGAVIRLLCEWHLHR